MTTFTEQDRRALESLIQKKQQAEAEEQYKKEQEVKLSKELFGTFSETINQMQNIIAVHEAQVSEMATRYKGLLPNIESKKLSLNDGFKEKYDGLINENVRLKEENEKILESNESLKKQYEELNNLVDRLLDTMERRPEDFASYVEWREKKSTMKNSQRQEKNQRPDQAAVDSIISMNSQENAEQAEAATKEVNTEADAVHTQEDASVETAFENNESETLENDVTETAGDEDVNVEDSNDEDFFIEFS